ncbi:MAG TPA: response regulator transcription factor [Terriglobales bacterium]|nr:response regulator transcription factor [Terriglobales bacterium]
MRIRVLIVDDHAVVRQGLRIFLDTEGEFEVVGEAPDGEEAVRLAKALRPDIVLMDLLMPGMGGIEATRLIRSELVDVEVVALTSVLDDESVVSAVRAGAIGYLLKSADAGHLRRSLRAAAAGQVQLDPAAAARLVHEVRAPPAVETLTDRESEVMRLLARGLANKEIGRDLRISEDTVKTHVSRILAKLGAHSRTQAVLHAMRMGLVDVNADAR